MKHLEISVGRLEYYDKLPSISNSNVFLSEFVDQNAFFRLVYRVQIDEELDLFNVLLPLMWSFVHAEFYSTCRAK